VGTGAKARVSRKVCAVKKKPKSNVLGRELKMVAPEESSWVVCVGRSSFQGLRIFAWKNRPSRTNGAHFNDPENRDQPEKSSSRPQASATLEQVHVRCW
jgi:hypothetical protein